MAILHPKSGHSIEISRAEILLFNSTQISKIHLRWERGSWSKPDDFFFVLVPIIAMRLQLSLVYPGQLSSQWHVNLKQHWDTSLKYQKSDHFSLKQLIVKYGVNTLSPKSECVLKTWLIGLCTKLQQWSAVPPLQTQPDCSLPALTESQSWIPADFLMLVQVHLHPAFKNNNSCAMSIAAFLCRFTTHRWEIRAGSLPHCFGDGQWELLIPSSGLKSCSSGSNKCLLLIQISEFPLRDHLWEWQVLKCQQEENTHSTSG